MNFILLQAAEATGSAFGGNYSFWIMMVLIFVVMYFFMIRPQQKRQKDLKKFRENLQKGDKVVTIGGIYGVIAEIKDNYVLVEVDQNIKLRFDKSSVLQDASGIETTK